MGSEKKNCKTEISNRIGRAGETKASGHEFTHVGMQDAVLKVLRSAGFEVIEEVPADTGKVRFIVDIVAKAKNKTVAVEVKPSKVVSFGDIARLANVKANKAIVVVPAGTVVPNFVSSIARKSKVKIMTLPELEANASAIYNEVIRS